MLPGVLSVVCGLVVILTDVDPSVQGTSAGAPVSSVDAQGPSGPTPYPADDKAWPGKGAIRVFHWMIENRKAFWLVRGRSQHSIVFVGDSLVGAWTSMGKDLPGLPVVNRGIGGEPSRVLLFRFKEDVLDLHPRAIVMLTGTNDLSAQQDIQQTRSNLVDMLDMAGSAQPGVPIVLCTLPPRDNPQAPVDSRRLMELNKLIASLAKGRPHVAVLDLYAQLADPDGLPHAAYFATDKLHMSPAGFKRFHDALLPVLKQLKVG